MDAALLDQEFLRPIPVVLMIAGVLTAATSPWVTSHIRGPQGGVLEWVYVALGCLVAALGAWMYRARPGAGFAYPALCLLGCTYVASDMVYLRVSGQVQFNSELWLLVAAGFAILRTRYLHPIMATALAGLATFWPLRAAASVQEYMFLVVAGIALGYLVHFLRVKSLLRVAHSQRERSLDQGRLEEALLEARDAQGRLQALTEGSPLGIFHTTATGTVDYANSRWCEIAGCGFEDYDRIRKAVHPDDQPALMAAWRAALAHGSELTAEFRYVHDDGTVVPCATRALPLRDSHGVITGFTGTLEDITRKKEAAVADRLAYERLMEIDQLKEIDRFRTQILNAAGHELNTPITPLRLQVYLLRSGKLGALSSRQAHSLDILDRNLSRLARLASDVLDVARLQSGRLKIEPQPLDVGRILLEAGESFEGPAEAAGIHLSWSREPGLTIRADATRFGQVLDNLLSNALKFTPHGGRITMVARRCATDPHQVEVEVADSGVGMEPHQISRLFQPFSQVHDTSVVHAAGTGLGLYICRGIMEQHGGTLDASSPGLGHGSSLLIRMPASPPAIVVAETPALVHA
ncbi:MAG: PAS domain-containing sensor histidine kinase [Thermoplasmatota archaeon]